MTVEQKLREAIDEEIDRRISEAFKQYSQHTGKGSFGEFKFTMPDDPAAKAAFQAKLRMSIVHPI